jgi:hypothetical protein
LNPRDHYCFHNTLLLYPVLSQLNPIHDISSYFWKSISILSSHPRQGLPSGTFIEIYHRVPWFSIKLCSIKDYKHWKRLPFDVRFVNHINQILKTVRPGSALQHITYTHCRVQAVFLHLAFMLRMRNGENYGKKYCGSGCSCIYARGRRVTYCNKGPAVTHTYATILTSVSGLNQIHCAFSWERPGLIRWLYVTKCENLPYVTTRSLFVLYKLSVSYLWPCCTLSSDLRRNRRDDVAVWWSKMLLVLVYQSNLLTL